MSSSLIDRVDSASFRVGAVVHALDKSRFWDAVLVQDLTLLPLVDMLGEEDRVLTADASGFAGSGANHARVVA
jgi:hypothetical protein